MQYTAHTAIIGAGITGLCSAYALSKKEQSVHLFENSKQVGGAIKSFSSNGYLAEIGPNSLLIKDTRVANLLHDIGLSEGGSLDHEILSTRDEAKKRYIVQGGKPIAMPSRLAEFIKTPLFTAKGKLRIAYEPFVGKYLGPGEESFSSFVTRRLGKEVLESAAAPFVSGIYAGDPDQISIKHGFPRMFNLVEKHGSILKGALAMQSGKTKTPHRQSPPTTVSFRSGMEVMPRAIADQLPTGVIKIETRIESIEQIESGWQIIWKDSTGARQHGTYKNLVISVPHHKLPTLPLPNPIQQKLSVLKEIKAPPVTSLVLGFKKADVPHPLDGFGMLIKKAENSPLLGVLFSSSMFDYRAPEEHVTLTCMMGGSLHPEYAQNSKQTVLNELRKILAITSPPTFSHRTEWPQAIPQYSLDYQKVIDAITYCEKGYRGLHLAANYYQGISVGDCIINGLELGDKLSKS